MNLRFAISWASALEVADNSFRSKACRTTHEHPYEPRANTAAKGSIIEIRTDFGTVFGPKPYSLTPESGNIKRKEA
jgi:hypothetical protein